MISFFVKASTAMIVVVGMAACCVCIALSYSLGPVLVLDTAVGAWPSAMAVFFALQSVWLMRSERTALSTATRLRVAGVYFALVDAICVLMLLMTALSQSLLNSLLVLLLCCAVGICTHVIWTARRHHKDLIALIATNGSESSSLLRNSAAAESLLTSSSSSSPSLQAERRVTAMTRACSCARGCNYVLLVVAALLLGILLYGEAVMGVATQRFGPRGTVVLVPISDGTARFYSVMFNCSGEISTKPTILLETDGSHGAPDMWPLQNALTAERRRVCVYDKPGLGFSSYLYR
jgi:hypothetical protein